MTIDRKTATDLAALYGRRENLQRHKERALDKNLWIGVLTRGSTPPDEAGGNVRSYTDAEQIIDAIGGLGAAAILTKLAIVEAIESEVLKLDEQIKALDGEV